MGFDSTRFLSKVDDEFMCAICNAVIENPVQTPCEHLFCKECIMDWLNVRKTCPVDSRPLTTNDLGNPSRVLRNLLNKLAIKCDFHHDGCEFITELEHLAKHAGECVYNMDVEVVCDKGCSMTVTRREYRNENCFCHLAKEVTKLRHELSEQKSNLEQTLKGQVNENRKLRDEINCQKERMNNEVAKLRHELSEQKSNFEQTLKGQVNENRKLRDELNYQKERLNSLFELPKWLVSENMKIGPLNFLECDADAVSFVQSAHALKPTKSCFKICVTGKLSAFVGLTRKGYFNDGRKGNNNKPLYDNPLIRPVGCTKGDVIECGIEFPTDFTKNAQMYLYKNEELEFKTSFVITDDELFPSIISYHDMKVKYYKDLLT